MSTPGRREAEAAARTDMIICDGDGGVLKLRRRPTTTGRGLGPNPHEASTEIPIEGDYVKRIIHMTTLALILLASAAARAQMPPAAPPPGSEPPPAAPPPAAAPPVAEAPAATAPAGVALSMSGPYFQRPLTNPAGTVTINGAIDLNLSKDAVLKPVYVTPNIYYGINNQLTVGLVHGQWEDIFRGRGGLCLGGSDRGCGKVYNNVTLDALYSLLRQADFDLAAHAGFDFRDIDQNFLGLHLSVALKWVSGPLAIMADPSLGVGLNKRDAGNKEYLTIPVRLGYQASATVAAFLDTGIGGPTSHFGDYYEIPAGVGALVAVAPIADVGAKFEFSNLGGKGHSADYRDLMILFRIHP